MKEFNFINIEKLATDTLEKILVLKTDDFIYKPPKVTISQKTTDIEIEVEGYGLFDPELAFKNFSSYFKSLVNEIKKSNEKTVIKTLKIFFNGFKKYEDNFFRELAKKIKQIGLNIKKLWIHTADIQGVALVDFEVLFKLISNLGDSNNTNFDQFSFQCANWVFTEGQPKFTTFYQLCKQLLSENIDDMQASQNQQVSNYLYQKKLRIQISGWWSTHNEAMHFLGFEVQGKPGGKPFSQEQLAKQILRFHEKMIFIISNLLEICSEIELMEFDMRNNNDLLQMKKLKEKINNRVTKSNRSQRSIISMRKGNKPTEEESEKMFRINAAM